MAKVGLVAVPFFLSDRHHRLAEAMVQSIQSRHQVDTIAIVNAVRSHADVEWLQSRFACVEPNDVNILARAWNKGIQRAFERGADFALVVNLDAVFHPLCIDNLVACAESEREAVVWSATRWNNPRTFGRMRLEAAARRDIDWSCFMVDRRLFDIVGLFDEGFRPAYLEDEDMCRRMALAGVHGVRTRAACFLHQEAGTIRGLFECRDEEIEGSVAVLRQLRKCISANDERYLRKWGGRRGTEKFTVPFDGKPEA